jgi:hypothetical protein
MESLRFSLPVKSFGDLTRFVLLVIFHIIEQNFLCDFVDDLKIGNKWQHFISLSIRLLLAHVTEAIPYIFFQDSI